MSQDIILVVDDSVGNLKLAEQALKNDFKLVLLTSGVQALRFLQKTKPSLIILDVKMPEMDGYETIRQIKANPETANIPVVFFSALGDNENELVGLGYGAADYISKPVMPQLLLHRVRMQLELHTYRHQLEELVEQKAKQISQLKGELLVAGAIQQQLLPQADDGLGDYEVYGAMKPVKEIGGDLYDFSRLDDHRLYFMIGDVSGKGMPAAMFMSHCLTLLRAAPKPKPGDEQELVNIVAWVNRHLSEHNVSSTFVTLQLGIFDTRSGVVSLCNAGHNPPILLPQLGSASYIEPSGGFILGIDPDQKYEITSLTLNHGDMFLLYTDGVTEANAANEEYYGSVQLLSFMDQSANQKFSAREAVEAIFHEVAVYAAGRDQSDDITVLAFKRR